jgi:hypothetical protein
LIPVLILTANIELSIVESMEGGREEIEEIKEIKEIEEIEEIK